MSKHDEIYKPEDEAAEKRVGPVFAAEWGLKYKHVGGESRYDGLLFDDHGTAFVFELKNRNIKLDGRNSYFTPKGSTKECCYPTVPLSKAKVEALYTESIRRKTPAVVVFHAKKNNTTWWVDVSRLLNLRVFPKSGRTADPLRDSDREDCVYIPVCWLTPMERPYDMGRNSIYGCHPDEVARTLHMGEQ
jgi:hypothetical protein